MRHRADHTLLSLRCVSTPMVNQVWEGQIRLIRRIATSIAAGRKEPENVAQSQYSVESDSP